MRTAAQWCPPGRDGRFALEAAASGLNIKKLVAYEPPYVAQHDARHAQLHHEAQLERLLAEGRRGHAVKYFMRDMVGVPGFMVVMMQLMRGVWKKLEAVAHTLPYDARIMGDVEIDIRPVTEPWDIGMVPMPKELATRRYMLLYKADAASESGRPRPAEQRSKLSALFEEMSGAKVLLTNVGLRPSQQGKRYTFQGGRYSVVDGPFAESKELIAGYAMFQAQSLEEASEWALRYGTAVTTPEVDLRVVEKP